MLTRVKHCVVGVMLHVPFAIKISHASFLSISVVSSRILIFLGKVRLALRITAIALPIIVVPVLPIDVGFLR